MVCVDNQQLEEAGEVHRLCIQAGLQPDAYAYNALINAYGCALQVPAPHPENLFFFVNFQRTAENAIINGQYPIFHSQSAYGSTCPALIVLRQCRTGYCTCMSNAQHIATAQLLGRSPAVWQ